MCRYGRLLLAILASRNKADQSQQQIRCGGTGLPQALGLFVSLPIRRAIARLVPSVYGTLPPREGGLHARLSHCIVHHAMAKQLPLS